MIRRKPHRLKPSSILTHSVQLRFADTNAEMVVPAPADRPVLIVSYANLDHGPIRDAINRANYGAYARVMVIGAAPDGGCFRPEGENIGPERVEMLPDHRAQSAMMHAACASILAGGGKDRCTLYGPHLAVLERGPDGAAAHTAICGPRRKGAVERAGPPTSWPPEILDLLLCGCERAVLDLEQPLPEVWRGRPAAGRSYVRIFTDAAGLKLWREAVRRRSPGAEIRVVLDRPRRAAA